MKTKYVKVPVSERLPEKSGFYNTDQGELEFSKELGDEFYFVDGPVLNVQYWLEEKEDHSEEMKQMIEEMIFELDPSTLSGNYKGAIKKAKQLINKVKDNG